MYIITVENVDTGDWFVAKVHSDYGLGENWIPCSYGSGDFTEKEIVDYLLSFDQSKLIDTPMLPVDEEYLLLRIYNRYVVSRIVNCDDYRRKIELIVKDREITGKSFIDAKNTIERFLANDREY